MSPNVATNCSKCGFQHPAPTEVCAKCGVIFARIFPNKARVDASHVTISTDTLSEPFNTIGPVYAITTNIKGVFENAANKLGQRS